MSVEISQDCKTIIESNIKSQPFSPFKIPKYSKWNCSLFGDSHGFCYIPREGMEPNWFWRKMQYLILGFKWTKQP